MKKNIFGNSAAGFTLIEVMIVIVILGVLGAMIVPNVLGRSDQARIAAAKSDLNSLAGALEIYHLDNHTFPSTEQGLNALIDKPSGSPEAKSWNPGGYIKKLQNDPWGNAYVYISPGKESDFDLYSLGKDGKSGGESFNADIFYNDL